MSEQVTEHRVDRTNWDPGPWDQEPDKLQWRDATTGLPCLIVRNSLGNLCGYAGVHTGHPLWGKFYNQCLRADCKPRTRETKAQIKLKRKQALKAQARGERWAELSLLMLKSPLDRDRAPKGVPKRHAYRHRHYQRRRSCDHGNTVESIANVHGGITFAGGCGGPICHIPEPGERRVWWFGFDCAHSMDLVPGMTAHRKTIPGFPRLHEGDTYRDIDYVKAECTILAKQLADWHKERELNAE